MRPGIIALAAIFARAPRIALALADFLARITLPAGRRRAPRELDARALRRFWSNHIRHLVVAECVTRYGTAPLRALILPAPELDALQAPCVVVTIHAGPVEALAAVFEELGSTLALRQVHASAPREVTLVHTVGGDRAAIGLVRAVRWLRDGGFVTLAIDPSVDSSRVHVPFRGKTLAFARGAFALARIANVPLVPVVTRWRGSRIELVFGETLAGHGEHELAMRVGRWVESYLDANPGEISQRTQSLVS